MENHYINLLAALESLESLELGNNGDTDGDISILDASFEEDADFDIDDYESDHEGKRVLPPSPPPTSKVRFMPPPLLVRPSPNLSQIHGRHVTSLGNRFHSPAERPVTNNTSGSINSSIFHNSVPTASHRTLLVNSRPSHHSNKNNVSAHRDSSIDSHTFTGLRTLKAEPNNERSFPAQQDMARKVLRSRTLSDYTFPPDSDASINADSMFLTQTYSNNIGERSRATVQFGTDRHERGIQDVQKQQAARLPRPLLPARTLGHLKPRPTEIYPSKLTCMSCQDDLSSTDAIYINCGHTWCGGCLNSNFCQALKNRSSFPPKCCEVGSEIDFSCVKNFLEASIIERYNLVSAEFHDLKPIYCAEKICSRYIPRSNRKKGGRFARCSACNAETCSQCWELKETHTDSKGLCPSKVAMANIESLAANKKWQECPNCKSVYEKSSGCNHMTCNCGTEFYYCCGSRLGACRCGAGAYLTPEVEDFPVVFGAHFQAADAQVRANGQPETMHAMDPPEETLPQGHDLYNRNRDRRRPFYSDTRFVAPPFYPQSAAGIVHRQSAAPSERAEGTRQRPFLLEGKHPLHPTDPQIELTARRVVSPRTERFATGHRETPQLEFEIPSLAPGSSTPHPGSPPPHVVGLLRHTEAYSAPKFVRNPTMRSQQFRTPLQSTTRQPNRPPGRSENWSGPPRALTYQESQQSQARLHKVVNVLKGCSQEGAGDQTQSSRQESSSASQRGFQVGVGPRSEAHPAIIHGDRQYRLYQEAMQAPQVRRQSSREGLVNHRQLLTQHALQHFRRQGR